MQPRRINRRLTAASVAIIPIIRGRAKVHRSCLCPVPRRAVSRVRVIYARTYPIVKLIRPSKIPCNCQVSRLPNRRFPPRQWLVTGFFSWRFQSTTPTSTGFRCGSVAQSIIPPGRTAAKVIGDNHFRLIASLPSIIRTVLEVVLGRLRAAFMVIVSVSNLRATISAVFPGKQSARPWLREGCAGNYSPAGIMLLSAGPMRAPRNYSICKKIMLSITRVVVRVRARAFRRFL